MPDWEPAVAQPLSADEKSVAAWAEARWRLEEAPFYWLATVRPSGRPHVMPVVAVWVDGALHFATGATSRKGRNLAHDPHCVITVASHNVHLVVEGEAVKVRDEAELQRIADAYVSKYDWHVTVRDGAFYGDGAPTAGPPPFEAHRVIPTTIFGFGGDESFSPTRWRFSRDE